MRITKKEWKRIKNFVLNFSIGIWGKVMFFGIIYLDIDNLVVMGTPAGNIDRVIKIYEDRDIWEDADRFNYNTLNTYLDGLCVFEREIRKRQFWKKIKSWNDIEVV